MKDVDSWHFFKSDRISRLRENENLEDAPSAVLKHLGELKRPYLTFVFDFCGGEAVGFD